MDYIKELEEERKKMMVFERELPFSLQLITQAIDIYRKQKFEVAEEIYNEGPVLEEFIPLRPSYSSSIEEEKKKNVNAVLNGGIKSDGDEKKKKPDWLESAQLWNQQPEQPKLEDGEKKPMKGIGGAFHPFEREKIVNIAPTSSTSNENNNGCYGNGGSVEKEKEKEGHSQRKARRCWSTDLHRRFLNALQELGGPHVATPKQIKELMKVDGLTNDEVKSHLQKYRLHNRRPTATPAVEASIPHQPPQIVLVGGIWVPPPSEHTTNAPSNAVYAPVPSSPSQFTPQQLQGQNKQNSSRSPTSPLRSERRRCDEGNKSNNNGERTSSSDASSSTSQTTTASPQ